MISRSLLGKVDESVRRTIEELSAQIDSLRSELATVKASSNGNAKLSAAQVQQVAGLIAGRSQAVFGLDIQDPQLPGQIGGGSVTSIGLSVPSQFAVANSPVTSTGTVTVTWNVQVKNKILSGPSTGADAVPTFRSLVAADLPASGYTAWTGTANRGSHATYSGTASVGYVQGELQGVMDALLQVTQAMKAIIDDLTHS